MINITKYSKLFNKKPGSFLDNPRIKRLIKPGEVEKGRGRGSVTLLSEKHSMEFLLWLHPTTRDMLAKGIPPTTIFEILDSYENS